MRFSSKFTRYFVVIVVSTIIFSGQTEAGAFQLWEQDSGGIGDYHAGAAAEANTAAVEFYNPAGITRITHQQVSFGGAWISLGVNYTGTAQLFSLSPPEAVNNVSGDVVDFVPNFHYVLPFSNHWAFGLGVTTPFGLETKYPNIYPVSDLATETKLETLNINPSIAYAINRYLSLGVGVDVLYGQAIYNSTIAFAPVGPTNPITSNLHGWNSGYNVGLLVNVSPTTRIGLSYRSEIKVNAKGQSQSIKFAETNSYNENTSAVFPLPATTILSVYHDFSRFTLMGSAFYTQWSVFHQLIIHNIATPVGAATIGLNENYRNTWNLSVGGKYKLNNHISLAAGFGHDETPTRDGMRDIRLPDADRYAGSLGVDIRPHDGFLWSMGWTHFFTPTSQINNTNSNIASQTTPLLAIPATSIGTVRGDINVFGIQFTCNI